MRTLFHLPRPFCGEPLEQRVEEAEREEEEESTRTGKYLPPLRPGGFPLFASPARFLFLIIAVINETRHAEKEEDRWANSRL